jgi:hypothetical protein
VNITRIFDRIINQFLRNFKPTRLVFYDLHYYDLHTVGMSIARAYRLSLFVTLYRASCSYVIMLTTYSKL